VNPTIVLVIMISVLALRVSPENNRLQQALLEPDRIFFVCLTARSNSNTDITNKVTPAKPDVFGAKHK
jgi:hypothetical protein